MLELDSAHPDGGEMYLDSEQRGTRVNPEDILIGLEGEQHIS